MDGMVMFSWILGEQCKFVYSKFHIHIENKNCHTYSYILILLTFDQDKRLRDNTVLDSSYNVYSTTKNFHKASIVSTFIFKGSFLLNLPQKIIQHASMWLFIVSIDFNKYKKIPVQIKAFNCETY